MRHARLTTKRSRQNARECSHNVTTKRGRLSNHLLLGTLSGESILSYYRSLNISGLVVSKKSYHVVFVNTLRLVEMSISTNHTPSNWANCFANTNLVTLMVSLGIHFFQNKTILFKKSSKLHCLVFEKTDRRVITCTF